MFNPAPKPRLFMQAPGVDFPRALVDGLRARMADQPPEAMARLQLIVNTRRMARRIRQIFDDGPPCLLPRISLLSDVADAAGIDAGPPAISALRRRLELTQLVAGLLDRQPDLAARSSIYDLADSLAELLDELEGEGVPPEVIDTLDVSDLSGHWERSKTFIRITQHFFDNEEAGLDAQARQRRVVTALAERWETDPPAHPVILAGSTGSRGTTLLLMMAIARLPQGAVILPGFDTDLPASVWPKLDDALAAEDHPQYRFRKLMQMLDLAPSDILAWHDTCAPAPARNAALSLALRPAPVTDAWLSEGPKLTDLRAGFRDVTLVEAPSPRDEALAIALRLRQAAEDGVSAALITPDRMLTRQVTSALSRWGILPDDSAGTPLHLSPPGRFLRHVTQMFQRRLTTDQLLTVLKHPLTLSTDLRGTHLLMTRELELFLRGLGHPFPDQSSLEAFAAAQRRVDEEWLNWLATTCFDKAQGGPKPLTDWVAQLIALAEGIAGNPGGLWEQKAGREARALLTDLQQEAPYGGEMSASDFADLLTALLQRGEIRDRDAPHPNIMIWGTLEARVQGADLMILGGLNDGTWPETARPDPWLNRQLRHKAGLLLPDRRIGLSAHDFQQAAAAPEVWLTRSVRSDDAQTVPSRWINRLTNLLGGLTEQDGPEVLNAMRARGNTWLSWARQLEAAPDLPTAPRPSPRPPKGSLPTQLSVTEIKRLIRDPYAIYARHVLRLRKLDPLVRFPDPRIKGIVIHEIFDRFTQLLTKGEIALERDAFLTLASDLLTKEVPWPTARMLWFGQLERAVDWVLQSEAGRLKNASPIGTEIPAKTLIQGLDFTLTARADRLDRLPDGRVVIYDYKTGKAPTEAQQLKFDKQLLLEAALAEEGAFKDVPPTEAAQAIYISLSDQRETPAPLEKAPTQQIWAEFRALIAAFQTGETGFAARRMLEKDSDLGDYDQLARFGEWDDTIPPTLMDLT